MKIHRALTSVTSTKRFGGLALLTLLLTLFSLTTMNQAHAADTIRKGVLAIADSNNTPVANVKYALWLNYTDGSSSHMSEVVTTGSDGKAIITIPKADYSSIDLMMQPPSNLGSIRTFGDNLFNATGDENLDYTFATLVKPASVVLSIKNPGGSVAAPGTLLAYKGGPADDAPFITQRVIDPTQFGLGIGGGGQIASSPAWVTGETYGMDIYPADGWDCNNISSSSFGFSFDGSNPRQVTFKNIDQSVVAPVNNVVTLNLSSPTITGKLLNHDGSAFTLGSGMVGYVSFNEVSENGDPIENSNYYAGSGCINSDGTWGVKPRADGSAHYVKAQYSIGGSLTAPTFVGSEIIRIVPNGQFDNTYGLGSGNASATLTVPDVRLPIPNIGFTFSVRDSQAIPAGYLSIYKITSGEAWYASANSTNQYISASLPVGNYRIEYMPGNSAYAHANIFVTVTENGVSVRRNQSDITPVTPTTPGLYAIVLENTAPVKVRAVTPTGATINSNEIDGASINSQNAGDYFTQIGSDGLITSFLPAGDYEYTLQPSWNNNPSAFQPVTYLLNVSSEGVATFKTQDQTSIPAGQDGVFNLKLASANFLFQLTKPDGTDLGDTDARDANIYWYSESEDTSEGFGIDSNGLGGGVIAAGTYTLHVTASGGSPRTYEFTVSNAGVVTFTNPVITADPVTGRFKISAAPANFVFKIVDPADSSKILAGNAGAYALLRDSNKLEIYSNADSAGFVYANVEPGRYDLEVGANELIYMRKLYQFTVSAEGVVTFDSPAPSKDGEGNYLLSPHISNFFYQIVNPDTNQPFSGKKIGGQIDFCNAGVCSASGMNQSGFGSLAIPVGTFELNVRVFNVGAYADRTYTVTVAQNGSITFTGTTPNNVNGNYILMPAKANFVATMLNPVGDVALTGSWFDICTVDGAGNTTSCRGYGSNSTGEASATLTDGNYQIRVNPSSSSGLAVRKYDVTVSGNGQTIVVTGATKDQVTGKWKLYANTPNVSGVFVDSTNNQTPITIGAGKGISMQLQRKSGDNWIWENFGFWAPTNSWVFNLTHNSLDGQDNTIYRIVATPQGIADLSISYSDLIYVNGSNQVSLTSNGSFTASLSAIKIVMRSPNVKLFIANPTTQGLGLNYGWVEMQKSIENGGLNGGSTWAGNLDLNPTAGGRVGVFLTEGTYTFYVNPPRNELAIAGLAQAVYIVTVDANLNVQITTKGGAPVSPINGVFTLSPATANVAPVVQNSQGVLAVSTNAKSIWAQLQVWNAQNNNWDWTQTSAGTDGQGKLSMSVTEPGKYRLRIDPNGFAGATLSYSKEFTVDAQGVISLPEGFSPIVLNAPSITIRITANGVDGLANTNFEIRKNGQFIDWGYTNATTMTGGFSLPDAGTYELTINPPWDGSVAGATKRVYTLTATKVGEVVTATVNGVTPVNGVSTLTLGTASLKGRVLSPSSSPVRDSQVIATDVATGKEMWEYSTNTSATGTFAMSLPAGVYTLMARAPYGSTELGNAYPLGQFTIDANGVVTTNTSGADAANITLALNSPTWLGTLKSPDGTSIIANAQICFTPGQAYTWSCANSNSTGQWALSAPLGFTAFDEYAVLEVRENFNVRYSMRRYTGTTALNALLGTTPCVIANSTPSCSIEIRLQAPNTQITVTAGGQPVANAWVNIDRDGVGWLGAAATDASGVARINILNPELAFNARVEIGGTSVANAYTSTFALVDAETPSGGSYIRSKTIALAQPNIRGIVTEPVAGGGTAVVPFTWIELFNESENKWVGGASTDINGAFSLNAPGNSSGETLYTINVNPSQNSTSINTKQVYSIVIPDTDVSAVPVVTVKSSGAVVTPTTPPPGNRVWTVSLAAPSVTGVVKASNGTALMNSWVVPIDKATGENFWQFGVNSRTTGSFSMALSDGTYLLEANTPWGNSTDARSARCEVTILSGAITTSIGGCVKAGIGGGKTVELSLRAPNLTFTLVDGLNNPVANAGVGIGFGNWNTYSQSSSTGKVSLFIDNQAIADSNVVYGIAGQRLRMWVDPPWGNTSIVRWECNAGDAPRCGGIPDITAATIGSAYPSTNAGTIAFAAPNTKLHVLLPGGAAAGQGAWVSIFNIDNGGGRYWIAGGVTDSTGTAAFNIDLGAINKLAVEVNAPYDKRALYSSKTYDNAGAGYLQSAVNNASYQLAAPNATFTVKSPNGTSANKWGWIGIERCTDGEACTSSSWAGGYGLDDQGRSSVMLSPEGGVTTWFRVTSYPGGGRAGSRTICLVSVTSAGIAASTCSAGQVTSTPGADVLKLTITLSSGNVTGVVHGPDNSPVVGAVVYANLVVGGVMSTDSGTAITTSTNATGGFGLQLDPAKQWRIKILALGRPDLASYLSTSDLTFNGDLAADLGTIKLEVVR